MSTKEMTREQKLAVAKEIERRYHAGYAIVGKTYSHRDTLKANKCLWDKNRKVWVAPDDPTRARMQDMVNGSAGVEEPPAPPPPPPPEPDEPPDSEPEDEEEAPEGHPFQAEAQKMAEDIGYETAASGVEVQVPIDQLVDLFCRSAAALYMGGLDVQELLDRVVDGCERGKADREAADEERDQQEAMTDEEAAEVAEEREQVVDDVFDVFDAGKLNPDSLDL